MKVVFYGVLRALAGTREMDSDSKTLEELFDELSQKFGEKMAKLLRDEDMAEGLTVVYNERVLPRSERGRIRFAKDDVVKLLSPIGGG